MLIYLYLEWLNEEPFAQIGQPSELKEGKMGIYYFSYVLMLTLCFLFFLFVITN